VLIARALVGLLLLASVLCFGVYIGTRNRLWLQRGVLIVKWTVLAGLGFFAVLILERLAVML